MNSFSRRTWAEINLDAVRHNYKLIRNLTNAMICPVIKANAYGHGATVLAKIYEELGASMMGVSNIDEAVQLRKSGIKTPILIFGYTEPKFANLLFNNDISQCVYSLEYAKLLQNDCKKHGIKIKIHIKVDTGMSRLGFYYQDKDRDFNSINEIRTACKIDEFIPEGIFSHFAVSDECSQNSIDFTNKQLGNLNDIIKKLNDINFKYKHIANSGGSLDYKNSHLNMIRAGIILYGLSPSSEINSKLDFKPVMSLKSVISHIKIIQKASTVSYGRNFTAEKDMRIATIPIGYADGYSRNLSTKNTDVLVGGKRCKIIGKICMDQLMVMLNDELNVNIGDTVTLMGDDISIDELANKLETINYEIACDVSMRVPRVYIDDNNVIQIDNYIL